MASWLGPITVLSNVDKCQINELYENVNSFLFLFDSFFPPFFSPSLPFFPLPLFHLFFLSSYLCRAPETTRVWFLTLGNMCWASHGAGIIFLWGWIFAQPEDKEAKARGHFLYIK